MSIEAAKEHLKKYGVDDRILEFDVSSATVELAAAALGCDGARITKTLSFLLDDGPILICMAGDAKVDNAKYKAYFGKKAKMLTPDEAIGLIGHAVGGVGPFGIHEGGRVYLDLSLRRFEVVYPACGSSNSAIPLSPEELERISECVGWIDVTKGWEVEP